MPGDRRLGGFQNWLTTTRPPYQHGFNAPAMAVCRPRSTESLLHRSWLHRIRQTANCLPYQHGSNARLDSRSDFIRRPSAKIEAGGKRKLPALRRCADARRSISPCGGAPSHISNRRILLS